EVLRQNVSSEDIIVGLAASGRTPYVHGAIKKGAEIGCKTVLVTTVSEEQVDLSVDVLVDVPVGPEVIMGSTRMKSATAQKMVLNMFTTGAMIRLGKVFENVMVDLQLTNKKLEERAKRIVMMLSNIDYEEATSYLENADFHVKTALMMSLSGLSKEKATEHLNDHNGFIRSALKDL
ncbi:MAG TPA: N-acetylmuramic acid 6-phosphate etherase, partial [Balneolaceae bacterium]|nr:N-acetylmuramic acid 6-phosphate etherase [Balneolaceae bacterium]